MSLPRLSVVPASHARDPADFVRPLSPALRLTLSCLIGAAFSACSSSGSDSADPTGSAATSQIDQADGANPSAEADDGVAVITTVSDDGSETLALLPDSDTVENTGVDSKATITPIAGKYYLKNACSNKTATGQYGSSPWDNMILRAAAKTVWTVSRNTDGTYVFKIDGTSKALQTEKVVPTAGTNANVYTLWNGPMQRWVLTAKGAGQYQMANASVRSMVLTAANGYTENTQMSVRADTGACAQRWTLVAIASTSTTSAAPAPAPVAVAPAPAPTPAPAPVAVAPAPTPTPVPGPAPVVAAPSPAPITVGMVNSIDTIIGDMSLENDAKLDGIPNFMWATGPKPAAVLMGSIPAGSKMQPWWQAIPSVKPEYKSSNLWTAFIQWFVAFEGVGNAGYNVRIETRRSKVYYLSRSTGKWKLLGEHPGTGWFRASKSNLVYADGNVDARTNADGSVSIKVPVQAPYAYHGVWPLGKINIANVVGDIGALFSTVQARLVIDDPARPDDRSRAVLLLQSGADYYPNMTANVYDSFPPSAGLSRSKRITSSWQSFNFATLDVARQDYTGASASISAAAFRQNPPPLE